MYCSNENLYSGRKKNIFAFWFVFSLILNGYATGIPGVSVGSFVFILIVLNAVMNTLKERKLRIETKPLVFGIVLSVTSFFGMAFLQFSDPTIKLGMGSQMIGLAKFWLWVLMASLVAFRLYDKECFTKWMVIFAVILTAYLIVQCAAFYSARIYLPNIFHIGPLKPYADGYADYENLGSSSILRPGSLLSESSFYGNFILCTTALYLDKCKEALYGKKLLFILFVSVGIILSGSTSAIIMEGIIFLMYFRRINASVKRQAVLIAVLVGAAAMIMWFNGLADSSVGNSLRYSFDKFSYLDKSTRFGKSYGYLELIPQSVLYFGAGIGNDFSLIKGITGKDSVYFNSLTALIIQSGLLGLLCFIVYVWTVYKESKRLGSTTSIVLLLVYVIKGCASGIYFATYGILFTVIIIGQIVAERNEICQKTKLQ